MKKGSFLYSGSVSGLLENAKACVWNCTVQNAEDARLLEANYSISSKQYEMCIRDRLSHRVLRGIRGGDCNKVLKTPLYVHNQDILKDRNQRKKG